MFEDFLSFYPLKYLFTIYHDFLETIAIPLTCHYYQHYNAYLNAYPTTKYSALFKIPPTCNKPQEPEEIPIYLILL